MKPTKGYYSLVQYCPDPSRAEAATIGVALFCPEASFAEARICESDQRIRRFFGADSFDPGRLKVQKQSIRARVASQGRRVGSLEQLVAFVTTFANELTLTAPRPMRVESPEQDLADLYVQLVHDGDGRARKRRSIPQLDEALREPHLASKVLRKVPVTIPIFNTQIQIPYAYQNGRLNLVRPERFPEDANQAVGKALQLATEGDLLYKHPDAQQRDRQLVVVAAFEPDVGQELPHRISQVLCGYNTRTIFEAGIPELLAEIEEQARPFADAPGSLDASEPN